jgi:hypothetical protein
MSEDTRLCPNCGELGQIEFGGKLWLDNVAINLVQPQPDWARPEDKVYELLDADPAFSADDHETGLVWTEDVYMRCTACDYTFLLDDRSADTRAFFHRYVLRPK